MTGPIMRSWNPGILPYSCSEALVTAAWHRFQKNRTYLQVFVVEEELITYRCYLESFNPQLLPSSVR